MLMPGVGMCPPSRYTASIASVNNTRRRRSGTRKMFANASKNLFMAPFDSRRLLRGRAHHLRGAPGLLDFLHGRFREQVSLHRDLARQLAGPEDLETLARLLNHAEFHQTIQIEHVPFQLLQPAQVDDGVMLLENVGETAFGEAAVQRHLAAFESALLAEPGSGALSF